jgi:hypothetical protein
MAGGSVLPRVHVMVICDEIETVAGQDDVINLTRVRTGIRAARFPYTHPQLAVYLQVAGRQGRTRCRAIGIRTETDEKVFESDEIEVSLLGPLTLVPVVWEIVNCCFPEPGVYYVQAYFDGKLANERLLILSEDEGIPNGRRTSEG